MIFYAILMMGYAYMTPHFPLFYVGNFATRCKQTRRSQQIKKDPTETKKGLFSKFYKRCRFALYVCPFGPLKMCTNTFFLVSRTRDFTFQISQHYCSFKDIILRFVIVVWDFESAWNEHHVEVQNVFLKGGFFESHFNSQSILKISAQWE